MSTMGRRAFLGVSGLGAAAVTVGSSHNAEGATEYGRLTRQIVIGVGKGEAASLSFVWIPRPGREQSPPLKVRLVALDLAGKTLAEKESSLAPFTGLSLEVERPQGTRRLEFFRYAFLDRFEEVEEEIFGGVNVFSTSSGKTSTFGAPIGLA